MALGAQADGCISIGENDEIESLTMGRICSFYYLKHQTMGLFATSLKHGMDLKQVPCLHHSIFPYSSKEKEQSTLFDAIKEASAVQAA